MKFTNALKLLVILCILGSVAACNLEVIVPKGGDVISSSGSHNCMESTNCAIEITDATFGDSFTATPKAGYAFIRWQGGGDFLCSDSTSPTCAVSNAALAGNTAAEAFIASSFKSWYIMPVFEFVGIDTDDDGVLDHLDDNDDNDSLLDINDPCPLYPGSDCAPITDTIDAAGETWAQASLFINLSWNDINAVCPSGICSYGGVLNGYDMTGWKWASVRTMNLHFSFYGSAILGPGPARFAQVGSLWAPTFFNYGWNDMSPSPVIRFVRGVTSDPPNELGKIMGAGMNDESNGLSSDYVLTNQPWAPTERNEYFGAWFYR